ncbi:MAG: hypothetical protein HY903_05785 [Deltaproteobacteria bacterium]|nr:hypothetical protein [Deltaproteobacteria bacterium]
MGSVLETTVSEVGAYHAEVWIRPRHLTAALAAAAALASAEYRWIITNPIWVVTP